MLLDSNRNPLPFAWEVQSTDENLKKLRAIEFQLARLQKEQEVK